VAAGRWLCNRGVLFLWAFVALSASLLWGQELEPRSYAQTPTGVNFIAVGYAFSTGNVLMDPALPIEGLDADLDLIFLRYTRSFALLGRSAKFKVVAPWSAGDWVGSLEGEEEIQRRRDSGAGDVRLALEVNFLGASALDRAALGEYAQRWIAGASIRVVAPTGDYDADKLLNLGSNRWTLQPEVGFSRAVKDWTFEGAASVWFFTDNDDFFGGNLLSQRPLHVLKSHVIYTFRSGFWTALGIGWGNGGQTFVNDQPRQTLQSNWRFRWSLAFPITPSQGIVLGLGSAVTRRAGGDYDTISIGYQYAWGGKG